MHPAFILRLSCWLGMFFLVLLHGQLATAQQGLAAAAPPPVLELSAAEQAWLAARHTVRARVSDYPPYMLTRPQPSGIAVDYLASVARRYGFKVEFVPDRHGFPAAVSDVRGPRRDYDLLLTFTRTPEREQQFAITVDYLTAPWVVYARRDSPYIIGLESLGGKTVAVEQGYVITHKIRSDYPEIRILEVAKSEEALLAVASGQADAYVGNLALATYLIKAQRFDNLVVTAPSPYGINTQAMAVRSDWPELAGIINKGIAAMTAEERNAINQKWGQVEFRPRIDYTLLWQVSAFALLVLSLFFYWNRKLAREIARRRQVEDGLRVARDLAESANRAKSVFLANMSHELRTPMNAIMGLTELVRRKLGDEKQAARLDTVLEASRHLLAIIDDILNLSRLEAEQVRLERRAFTLDAVFGNLADLLRPEAQAKGLTLAVELEPELAARPLLGDAACLGQVLFKLTGNAIKFTAAGTVGLRVAVIEDAAAALKLRFTVSDTGIGIPAADRQRLFTAFEQVDGSSTRGFGGAGLGLAICKRLVAAMGGEIGVDSQTGSGSSFWFVVRFDTVRAATPLQPATGTPTVPL